MGGLVFLLVLVGAAAFLALRSYRRPDGVIVKSLIGGIAAPSAVAALWLAVGSRIANEAGLGFFALFLAIATISFAGAVIAIAAALARRLVDALNR